MVNAIGVLNAVAVLPVGIKIGCKDV